MSGSGNEFLYGPEFLLEEDVILVGGNYRLSALGFLSTFTEEFPGNYGMKDQVQILKWVQQNIGQFGGDPKRVTIFGESAGAGSVGFHMMSPMSQGLFHGAIMQSGSPYESWNNISHAQTLIFTHKFFDGLGCEYSEGNYKSALQCLRKVDAKTLVYNLEKLNVWGFHPMVTLAPVKEVNSLHPFLTELDYQAKEFGPNIPIMFGLTNNEGAVLMASIASEIEKIPDLEKRFDELIGDILFMYDNATPEKIQQIKQYYLKGQNFNWATMKKEFVDVSGIK